MIALIAALGIIAVFVLLFIFLPVVAWIILGLILLLLILILVIPIGADVGYVDGEFKLAARADGFALQLLPRKPADPDKPPRKPKEKKPKKTKEKKEKEEESAPKEKTKKFDFTVEEIFELIKKVLHGLGKFGKLTVHRFMLHFVAGGEDPYNTAMTYGYVNAALSSLAPVAAQKFRVKGDVDVWTDVDFAADKMKLDAELSITIRLAQVVHMVFAVAFGALGILIKNKIRLSKEKRQNKKNPSVNNDEVINIENAPKEEKIQAEERNDLHG